MTRALDRSRAALAEHFADEDEEVEDLEKAFSAAAGAALQERYSKAQVRPHTTAASRCTTRTLPLRRMRLLVSNLSM